MESSSLRGLKNTLIIIGCGGHGIAVADAARKANNWASIVFYDDNFEDSIVMDTWEVKGTVRDLLRSDPPNYSEFIVGIGDNLTRSKVTKSILATGLRLATVVHPWTSISQAVTIGAGSVIMAGAVVNIGVQIYPNCIINSNSTVEHDCVLSEGAHISSGAQITGGVFLGKRAWVGAGATVINQSVIGTDAVVGAASTVLRDVPSNVTVVGSPARVLS